ncbi:hypothetical protein BGW80DRAFT_632475 [Lactifluus volemus]|nr:hypothetical protein BGW80DRAFT_632475 [Lactifluus volemus]
MQDIDFRIVDVWSMSEKITHNLIHQIPGVRFDSFFEPDFAFSKAVDSLTSPTKPLSVFPLRILRELCSIAPELRDIIEGKTRDVSKFQWTLDSLKNENLKFLRWSDPNCLMESQMARLYDIRFGGVVGFSVELLFISLKGLLPISRLEESQVALYAGTLKMIAPNSDWGTDTYSPWTQKMILDVVCDFAEHLDAMIEVPDTARGDVVSRSRLIADGLEVLLRNVFARRRSPHIDDVVERLGCIPTVYYSERYHFLQIMRPVVLECVSLRGDFTKYRNLLFRPMSPACRSSVCI